MPVSVVCDEDTSLSQADGDSISKTNHVVAIHGGYDEEDCQPVEYEDIGGRYVSLLEDGYTEEEERRLVWKIDLMLIPFLWFNVVCGAMDKVSISTGALYGMLTDLDLKGTQYSWLGSAFYFGYLVWCFPTASLLQKFPIGKVIGVSFCLWGLVLIGSGFVKNFPTMVATRVLLGFLEAPVVPGNMLIVTMWYTREEQALRTGLFYTGMSTIFTGIIGYSVGGITGQWYNPWRAFFWAVGVISFFYGILTAIFLPDSPATCWWLNEREKAIAIHRIRKNQTGVKNSAFKKDQLFEAFLDPKVWAMFMYQIFISIPNGGLSNFSTLVIQGLGYTGRITTLVNIPTGLMQTVSSYMTLGSIYLFEKYKPHLQVRGWMMLVFLVPALISAICLYKLPLDDYTGRLVSVYFSYFYLGPYIASLSLLQANVSGTTKKVVVNSIMFIAYSVSNLSAPQFWKAYQAPYYSLGIGATLGAYALSIFCLLCYMYLCWRDNSNRDRIDHESEKVVHEDTDFKDLTDIKNVHFRYKY